METIALNSVLHLNENQIQNVRKELGYEDDNRLKQDIEQLRDWILKQNHFVVKEFDEGYLERLLIYNKGSIERAKQKFDKLCTCTYLMPEFLQNFDVKNDFQHLHNVAHICILPKPTHDNYRMITINFTGIDDKNFKFIDYFRYIFVLANYMICHDYCFGYIFIIDWTHVTLGTATKISPMTIHKGMTLILEGMGLRMKNFHFISGSKFFDSVLLVIMQGFTKKLKERIVVHPNYESLYKYVPSELLPKDFGGSLKTTSELKDITFKEVSSDAKAKFLETIATDESQRLSCKFNEEYSGMPGSFKSLCVD